MTDSPKIELYIGRSRVATDERPVVTMWSDPGKAKSWIESRVTGDVTWSDDPDSEYAKIAEIDGNLVGRIETGEVMDPVSLASRYPDQLPGYERIPDENPVIHAVARGDRNLLSGPSDS